MSVEDGPEAGRQEEILRDPFVGVPAPPLRSPKPGFSPWALGGLLSALLLGPIGAVLAIVLGFVGRKEAQRDAHAAGRRWSTVAVVLGGLLATGWGVAGSYVVWTRVLDDREQDPPAEPVAARPPPHRAPPAPTSSPEPAIRTRVERQGRITVVDLGLDAPSFAEGMGRQRAEAAQAKETLVLMTTARGCEPCQGVDTSLRDPLLQTALANVRLVRVDVRLFHDDLEPLGIPDDKIPGFYLLDASLSPRDGVDGGEWDDDIAANIAPVLGAFVRGKYKKRRDPWKPSGITL